MGGRKHKKAATGGPQEAPRDWIFHVRCYDVAGAHHEFIISKSTLAVEARFLDSHGRTVRAAPFISQKVARNPNRKTSKEAGINCKLGWGMCRETVLCAGYVPT